LEHAASSRVRQRQGSTRSRSAAPASSVLPVGQQPVGQQEFVEVQDQSHLDFDLVLWVGRPEVGGRRRLMDRACGHGRVAQRQQGVEVTGGEAERNNRARRRATRRRRAPHLARSTEGLLARRPALTETRDGVLHRPLARQNVGDVVPDGATHLRRTFPQERKHAAAAQHTATCQFRRPLANAQAQMLKRKCSHGRPPASLDRFLPEQNV